MRPASSRPIPLLVAAALALAAGCDEQVPGSAGAPDPGASGQPVLTQNRPATPAPQTVATPVPPSLPPVATPVAQPVAQVTPTPAPISPTASPSGSPTPSPGGSPTASPSGSPTPAPSPSGPFTKTQVATDLAVSGPGYFVLSTKPYPTGIEDLLFTRHGKFRFKADTIGAVAVQRLRHADHAFHVVGWQTAGEQASPPLETMAEDYAVLATTWGGANVGAIGLYLDADRNPTGLTQAAFDFTGKLSVAGAAPRVADGGPGAAYVAIAQFDSADRLVPAVGFPGIFRYETSAIEPDPDEQPPEPGMVRLGVAVSGPGRTVGNANLIVVGSLETP